MTDTHRSRISRYTTTPQVRADTLAFDAAQAQLAELMTHVVVLLAQLLWLAAAAWYYGVPGWVGLVAAMGIPASWLGTRRLRRQQRELRARRRLELARARQARLEIERAWLDGDLELPKPTEYPALLIVEEGIVPADDAHVANAPLGRAD